MLKKLFLLFCVFFLFIYELEAQNLIKGKVIDASTKQSLAFVSVQEIGTINGVLSDIDGKFQITLKNNTTSNVLVFSYLGYQKKEVLLKLVDVNNCIVELDNLGLNLAEVVVEPGVNPALRIMKQVAKNVDMNNPHKMQSFSYSSYNKMFVTGDVAASEDSIKGFDEGNKMAMQKFFSKQHLFLTESVSKREFLFPSFNNETVLASRVSGFKAAPFTLLATQMQSFSFYDTWVNVFDVNYLNPIDGVAIKKYSYTLEDTLYDKKDTVFIISFKPKVGKNFKGLKGVLYINTNQFAVQNVIAEPSEANQQISVKIQQKYEFIQEKQWFPVQLNTDWVYNNIQLKENKAGESTKMKAVSRSYVRDIILNPELSKKGFTEVELSIAKNADQKGDDFWIKYRADTLTERDAKTYQVVDSVGKKENFDKKILGLEALFTGEVPVSIFNFKLKEIFTFNAYEGYRLGLGVRTNNKLSSMFSVGGYGAYGFYDKAWKYGGNLDLRLWKKKELYLEMLVKKDVIETGNFNFHEKQNGFSNMELIRNLSINQMDKVSIQQLGFSFRMFKYFKTNVYVNHQQRISKYAYKSTSDFNSLPIDTFNINEAGIKFKFLFREKFMETLRNKISLGSDYPVVYLNISNGFKMANNSDFNGDWEFVKLECKVNYSYKVSTIGKQNICFVAGKLFGEVPYSINYSALGNNYYKIAAASEHTFETMIPNEFISNQFAATFFSHNFGRFLKPSKKFNPEIELIHAMAIGTCDYSNRFLNVPYKTMEKGYFESGVKINCLVKSAFSGIGVGVYYRYGAYSLNNTINNFAFKLTFGLSIN
ncbi:MAG: carboxypeptidase-like regulatory domain-containing protein [Bacteroidetes bacterium]|nr:carboxypeptidase-like regulatory domain-containing protein [Bacteroidota bacterium]